MQPINIFSYEAYHIIYTRNRMLIFTQPTYVIHMQLATRTIFEKVIYLANVKNSIFYVECR